MNKQQTVGFITCEDYQAIVTLAELEIHAARKRRKMSEYCDRKIGGDLFPFKFDPITGEEIEWHKLKQEYEDIE